MLRRFYARLHALWNWRRKESELDAEIRFHLTEEADEQAARGLTPERARVAATRDFGNVALIREDTRETWGWGSVERLLQDGGYGVRALMRRDAFAATSIVTLALGIGATTAIFSVVYGILLRPMAVLDPDRLVRVVNLGYVGELLELRQRARTMDVAGFLFPSDRTMTGFEEPLRLRVVGISGDLLSTVGRRPHVGQGFSLEQERPGAQPAAILSHALWQQRFGADLGVIGRAVLLDGVAHEVRGVMPADFRFPTDDVDLWVPMTIDPSSRVGLWASGAVLIGRLHPDVTLEDASDELQRLGPQFRRLFPWEMPAEYGAAASVVTWRDNRFGDVRPTLLMLLATVAAVLLIATVNLTSLQSVRATARGPEFALRAALGASRSRIARQLLTENAVLGIAGGALGVAIAYLGVPLLVSFLPAAVPRAADIAVDGVVLAFAAGVSLVTGLAVGLYPAVRASGERQSARFSGQRGRGSSLSGGRLGAFVAVEIGAAVVLVIGAALLARSLGALVDVDVGFSDQSLVASEVAPSVVRYSTDVARLEFFDTLQERLRGLPFVRATGLSTAFQPFGSGGYGSVFIIEGRPDPSVDGGAWPWADLRTSVSPDFLSTLGVRIVSGRPLSGLDREGAPRVVLVSERLAAMYWPDAAAVGQRIRFPGSEREEDPWRTVVGVVGDVLWRGPTVTDTTMFLPLHQAPDVMRSASLIVRSASDPALVADNLRAVVSSLDADTPISRIRTVDDVMAQAVSRPRFATYLVLGFAGLGALLGMTGIYGVVTYAAGRQRREVGIRLALGATHSAVRARFVGRAMVFAAVGVIIGEIGAGLLMPTLSSQLFGVSPRDPLTFAAVPSLFLVFAWLASYVSARRATSVDPASILRTD